ncbi:phosphate uptake regulator, PhoU [Solidesulfovibrio carbinoliphilus subsp. oakridgensis]|uniref:Phosphate-specific transport system accessory protein PhoU n=1 Tax=Solidesulfovibrio carbinoliphilus subsp. oakridgensis TaxID=694327 RepID=G7QE10_9BACT|nr:phosphate signaling complex protein PhoU [Solidesulfovibrio carbinoliphilus]EHJ46666.1 phosphate uptake regulator, PhoU [Solidesulfovibrio carbinoliphilus subsp. oakridgensis]
METRSHFHAELDALKQRVIGLSERVEASRQGALAAYLRHDLDVARQVIEADKDINRETCDIDEACLRLLALEQPVALDLRRIVGYARMVINLERLADEAVSVAEGALTGVGLPGACDQALGDLAEHAGRMYNLAAHAFAADDLDGAMEVCRLDEKARELAVAAMRCITEALSQCQAAPEASVRAILAARSFERMGGHAANIGEILVFILRGVMLSQQCQPR